MGGEPRRGAPARRPGCVTQHFTIVNMIAEAVTRYSVPGFAQWSIVMAIACSLVWPVTSRCGAPGSEGKRGPGNDAVGFGDLRIRSPPATKHEESAGCNPGFLTPR